MDQGMEQKVGVLELGNNFPKSLGLSNYSNLGHALKYMLTGLIDSLLNYATTGALLRLLLLGDFLSILALQLDLCYLQGLNFPYLFFHQLHPNPM